MKHSEGLTKLSANRRSFLKKGVMGAGAAALSAGLLPGSLVASAQGEDDGVSITKGDIAILTFLQALEQVEADLWIQYSELGGRKTIKTMRYPASTEEIQRTWRRSPFLMGTCRSIFTTTRTMKSATPPF